MCFYTDLKLGIYKDNATQDVIEITKITIKDFCEENSNHRCYVNFVVLQDPQEYWEGLLDRECVFAEGVISTQAVLFPAYNTKLWKLLNNSV